MSRRACKVDANQREIIAALEAVGAYVVDLSAVGKGCSDLLVGFRGKLYCVEIKDGAKSPSRRKLTEQQGVFHTRMFEVGVCVIVATSAENALRAIGATS